MKPFQITFDAIGTQWVIDFAGPLAGPRREQLMRAVRERIRVFDDTYSRFKPDSLVMNMKDKPGTYAFPEDVLPLITLYKKMYDITGGAVTPLIGSVLEDAGYDAGYSLDPKPIRKPPSWDDAIEYKEKTVTLKIPATLDFGAAGKGYIIDLVSEILNEYGVTMYCVDAGGDMRYMNAEKKPLRVGLEHPSKPGVVIGAVNLTGGSICGSAGNRRAWRGLHHIFDPRTLKPVNAVSAVWVTAETALLADALATALFFTDGKTLGLHFQFEYLILYPDDRIEQSSGFNAELFYAV